MPKPPLGLLGALRAGFAVVNKRLELALFPLALDLFLWLGPKLSLKPFWTWLNALIGQSSLYAYSPNPPTAQDLEAMRAVLTDQGNRSNLFATLSPGPLGVPSLMQALGADRLPAGVPQLIWPVTNPLFHLDLYVVFSLVGLLLGAVYFNCIAQQIRADRPGWRKGLRQVLGDWVRLTVFAAVTALALGLVLVAVWMAGSLVTLLFPAGAPLAVGLAVVVSLTIMMWVVFYLGFTVPGIVVRRRGLLGAVWDSVRVVQWSLPATTRLYAALFLINLGLGYLWGLVTPDSWVMLAAIGGNALVSTALVAALFVYYQDRYRWWDEMRRVVQANLDRQKAVEKKLAAG
jgi:hypothetical protein